MPSADITYAGSLLLSVNSLLNFLTEIYAVNILDIAKDFALS
jgi:hypothetical protein